MVNPRDIAGEREEEEEEKSLPPHNNNNDNNNISSKREKEGEWAIDYWSLSCGLYWIFMLGTTRLQFSPATHHNKTNKASKQTKNEKKT